jgi:hypothetical protein
MVCNSSGGVREKYGCSTYPTEWLMEQSPGKFIILIIAHDSCSANTRTYLARATVYLITWPRCITYNNIRQCTKKNWVVPSSRSLYELSYFGDIIWYVPGT